MSQSQGDPSAANIFIEYRESIRGKNEIEWKCEFEKLLKCIFVYDGLIEHLLALKQMHERMDSDSDDGIDEVRDSVVRGLRASVKDILFES